MLHSVSDTANLFAENFSKNSNLEDPGVSLLAFLFRTTLKMHNIPVTPKLAKKVKTNLASSKASGFDCIPVVVLRKYESELSYILSELFNMCLKEFSFLDCWKVVAHLQLVYLRMLGRGLQLKTTAQLDFFMQIVKSLKNL